MSRPVLIPHIWVQPSAPGFPDVFAGQVMTGDGRPAHYGATVDGFHYFVLAPVRLAPQTQAGIDLLGELLCDDIDRAKRGAA